MARAQDVIAQPPPVSATPPVLQDYQNNNPMQVFTPSETAPGLPNLRPFQWGPVTLHPHVLYRFLYGNGIQSSPGQRQNTILQTLSPGITFGVGQHWILDYTPTLSFYSSSRFRDTLDHNVRLGWGTTHGDWVLGGSQSYSTSSGPYVETGAQTERERYLTAFNAAYQFNTKMSLDMGVNQDLNYVGNVGNSTNSLTNLTDSKQWSTLDWLNYQFWPRLNAGIGIGYGYVNVQAGPDVMFEQYQGRVNWRATDKVSFRLSGGLQDQQYLSGGAGDLLSPIFGATIQYQPFAQTRLSLTASRTVNTSYFENQTTENTGITGGLNQRLLGRLYLDLNGGYGHSKYVSSATLPNQVGYRTGRNEDHYSFNVRLTCPFLRRGTFAVFYQYSDNSSSQTGFVQYYQTEFSSRSAYAYTSSQVGFEIGFRY